MNGRREKTMMRFIGSCEIHRRRLVRFIGSSRRREKTMMTTRSSKPDIPPSISMDWLDRSSSASM
jgi:hypothetical protein